MSFIPFGYTNAESIRAFLEFWPKFQAEFNEVLEWVSENQELIYKDKSFGFSWVHLYELPIKEHFLQPASIWYADSGFQEIYKDLFSAKDQIAHIPLAVEQIDAYIDTWGDPSKEDALKLLPIMAAQLGLALSAYYSLQCVLYFGCFLNELIVQARAGDDKALFNAIRIDPTVIGCKTAVQRITRAVFVQDKVFLNKLKSAINGKLSKREQANFQKMRLVLEVLYEAKSQVLNDEQLKVLFVDTLNLYSWNDQEGGNAKSLRKFVDTYMKKYSTT